MSNIPITVGSGSASVATEQIGTINYQLIKVVDGTAASTNKWVVNSDGSAQVSVVGTVAVTGSIVTVGSGSISGAVNISGSVLLGSSSASVITVSTGSVITVLQSSSIIAVVTGSVVAVPAGNQSISGAINVSGSVLLGSSNASVISVIQSSSIIGVVTGSVVAIPTGNQSISGAINVSGSVLLGSSNASVISVFQSSSIIGINAGSVVAISQGSVISVLQSPSIVGTYAEDAAHTTADKGLFILNVRNDTLASVTSADGDYGALSVGPVGEGIFANAPITKWISGTADFRGNAGASILVTAAQSASVFSYITGVQIANMGPSSVLVTLASGGSTLGYSIAPAGGGSNIYYQNGLKTPQSFGFAASISGISSVLVSAQGFISKT